MQRAPEIIAVREQVSTRTFLSGAREHTEGLAGYVRDFLAEHAGVGNENGRAWTVESCADALGISPPTLRRWLDQGKPAPLNTSTRRARESNARTARRDPEQRRAVVDSLPSEVRDELRAELVATDSPHSTPCRHCPTHCPGRHE
jgi:hypothetical protein